MHEFETVQAYLSKDNDKGKGKMVMETHHTSSKWHRLTLQSHDWLGDSRAQDGSGLPQQRHGQGTEHGRDAQVRASSALRHKGKCKGESKGNSDSEKGGHGMNARSGSLNKPVSY